MLYLDNAATSARKPARVYARLFWNTLFFSGNAGRGGYKMSLDTARAIVDTQDLIAQLMNISNPQNIVFTQNATYALNTAIFGTEPGHVVITAMEHNSVLRPAFCRGNYTVAEADKYGLVDVKSIEDAIREDTKLIVCTHASNVCGTIQPVAKIGEIAKKHNIPFLIDAAQTAGCLDIDAEKMNADMIAFSGHKGLMGPLGTGGLYIKNPEKISPFAVGGTGSNSESVIQPEFMPDKFLSGTINTPAIAALGEGVRYILKHGIDEIREHEIYLAKQFKNNLKNMENVTVYGAGESVASVAFNIDGLGSEEAFERLGKNVAVRAGYHCAPLAHKTLGTERTGAVRASFGLFNNTRDVSKITDCVYRASREFKG